MVNINIYVKIVNLILLTQFETDVSFEKKYNEK